MGIKNLLGIGEINTGHNVQVRRSKAKRLFTLLSRFKPLKNIQILDLGAGTGLIARELQHLVGDSSAVTAADVRNRMIDDTFPFIAVQNGNIQLADNTVDVILSNHVIEHVGNEAAQKMYLRECRRVLDKDGLLYLALPNRWTLFEPHYKTPFLSWPPEQFRNHFLAFMDRLKLVRYKPNLPEYARGYPLRPLSRRQATRILEDCGFRAKDVTCLTMQLVFIQDLHLPRVLANILAPAINLAVRPFVPTITYLGFPQADKTSID